jgi:hypothetical protein
MGLLDDAIREHLELKRQRGADTAEIARLEHEAFGPLRRAAEEPAEPPTSEAASLQAPIEEVPRDTHLHLADDPSPATGDVDRLVAQHEPPRPHGDPSDALPGAPLGEPGFVDPRPAAPSAEAPADELSQPTRAFDADEVRAATQADEEPATAEHAQAAEDERPGEEGEGVLEETPEFLHETPEHDRLWFEQRPPRDSDF